MEKGNWEGEEKWQFLIDTITINMKFYIWIIWNMKYFMMRRRENVYMIEL